jgi:hypothetical protein
MSVRREFEAERLRRIRNAEAEEARAQRRSWLSAGLLVAALPILALAIVGWGMHTTDPTYGSAAVEVGILLGNAGVLVSLLWIAQRRRR